MRKWKPETPWTTRWQFRIAFALWGIGRPFWAGSQALSRVYFLLSDAATWFTRLSETDQQRRKRKREEAAREKELQKALRRGRRRLNAVRRRAERAIAQRRK
jgi:hypothetical protein